MCALAWEGGRGGLRHVSWKTSKCKASTGAFSSAFNWNFHLNKKLELKCNMKCTLRSNDPPLLLSGLWLPISRHFCTSFWAAFHLKFQSIRSLLRPHESDLLPMLSWKTKRDLHKTHKLCWYSMQARPELLMQLNSQVDLFKVQATEDQAAGVSYYIIAGYDLQVQRISIGHDYNYMNSRRMTRPMLYKTRVTLRLGGYWQIHRLQHVNSTRNPCHLRGYGFLTLKTNRNTKVHENTFIGR